MRHIFVIIFPLVALLILICPWLLYAFGPKYVSGVLLLRLLLISCLPKAISAVFYALCRVERTTYKSAIMQGYICVATLSSTMFVAHKFGIVGIGISILLVQTSAGAAFALALRRELHNAEHHAHGRHRRRSFAHRGSEDERVLAITRE